MKRLLSLFLISTLVFASCSNQGETSKERSFTDDMGRTITIPNNPKRIVSASPSITQIFFAMGADSLLVGRTQFCTFPKEAEQIENIGGITNLNVEKILSLNPDLVIASGLVPEKSAQQLQEMGVPIACIIDGDNLEDLFSNIDMICDIIGHSEKSDSLINNLHARLNELPNPQENEKPTLYYVVGFGKGGDFTAGQGTFINDIINHSGAQNIAEDLSGWEYSLEQLVAKNPDYILLRQDDSASFVNMAPYSKLDAVKKGRVITIESGMIDLLVPRNIDAIVKIHNRIYNN